MSFKVLSVYIRVIRVYAVKMKHKITKTSGILTSDGLYSSWVIDRSCKKQCKDKLLQKHGSGTNKSNCLNTGMHVADFCRVALRNSGRILKKPAELYPRLQKIVFSVP